MGMNVHFEMVMAKVANYVTQMDGEPLMKRFQIVNQGDTALEDVTLSFGCTNEKLLLPLQVHIDLLPAGVTLEVEEAKKILLNSDYLANVEEKLTTELVARLHKEEEEIYSQARQFSVMPPNFWPWDAKELLASFVTPKHPLVPELTKRVSEYLKEWTGEESRTGYYSGPDRVLKTCAAIFETIKERQIGYAVALPSHDNQDGQMIRLIHHLLRENAEAGNCLAMSCLFCTVAEALGLNPFLELEPGHARAGCHLDRKTFQQPVIYDTNTIRKQMIRDLGNGKIGDGSLVVLEATMMNAGSNADFFDAVRAASRSLAEKPMDYAVDVVAARRAGISALPYIENEEKGFSIQAFVPGEVTGSAPDDLGQAQADPGVPTVYTKQEQWERRMLNIDLRNPLINSAFDKRSHIPLCCSNMAKTLEALHSGNGFEILQVHGLQDAPKNFEKLGQYDRSQQGDLEQQRLRAPIADDEILKRTRELTAINKKALEERGAGTLFVTGGILRWYETPASGEKPHYAPLVMYPAELKPSGSRFLLQLAEEQEVQLNPPLMEMLKRDYGVTLPQWESLPLDSRGQVDFLRIMASIRRAVEAQPRWDVLTGIGLGSYNFTDVTLWRDIRNHADVLEGNRLVASLMAGYQTWESDDGRFARNIPGDTKPVPLATDASQRFAIEAAADGQTFVLHGPPGCGKTQCIAGTVAVAAEEGKTTLFVAEKQAAVNVAWQRLEEMGLGDFCLNLHSTNTPKGPVLEQLGRILELAEEQEPLESPADGQDRQLQQAKEELDGYAEALHKVRDCGMSLHQLIGTYETVADEMQWIDPEQMPCVKGMDAASLARQEELLDRMERMVEVIGNPKDHALRQVSGVEFSQSLKQKLTAAVGGYRQSLVDLARNCVSFEELCKLPKNQTYKDILATAELAQQMVRWSRLPQGWAADADLETTLAPLEEIAGLHLRAEAIREGLLQKWKEEFLEADHRGIIREYNKAVEKLSMLRYHSLEKLNRKLEPMQKECIRSTDLGKHLLQLHHYHSCLEKAAELQKAHRALLCSSFGEPPYDWKQIQETVTEAALSDTQTRRMMAAGDDTLRAKIASNTDSAQAAEQFLAAWTQTQQKQAHVQNLLGIPPRKMGDSWLVRELRRCDAMEKQIGQLKDWLQFDALCRELRDNGMDCLVQGYMKGWPARGINRSYRKNLCQSLIGEIIDGDSTLSRFNGKLCNGQIQLLQTMDKEVTARCAQDIRSTLIAKVKQVVAAAKQENSGLTALKKAIRSKGRGMTLRKIMEQHLPLIRKLCPCLMMSPGSVAQYLPMENGLFDLVLFDEASQIPTARAVGAIARGINCVVVGDCNQMPPTTFFTSTAVDEDNLETEDMESILDDCLALNIPATFLKWHYRSHESIIAFSNNRFYGNRLLTFPSARDRSSHVRLHYMEDARYENRRNRKEAEAIIDYLRGHAAGEDRAMSLGIITFNIEQQQLVEELLHKACREDDALRNWMNQAREPVFVKNLENAQGDERDVILLSTNYGPNENGKVAMNFGPLTKEGGWRRLNVAVTRARQKMEVFTSLLPEQIDLSRTRARGTQELRAFLEYAGGKQLSVNRGTLRAPDAPGGIAKTLCSRLENLGYQVEQNVGFSDVRVDLAVVHPDRPEQYVMGILLDGGSFARAKTTRDRVLTDKILRDLGWNIHRIWSVDWFDSRERELSQLEEALTAAVQAEMAG